jgi:lysyl-tRNA synthetase class 2
VRAATGGLVAVHEDGLEVDFTGPWAETTLYGSLSEALGEEIMPATPLEVLLTAAERLRLPIPGDVTPARLAESLFDASVAPTLQRPTFVFDYPVETSPLTRGHRQEPGLAEKWDLYVRGMELATAYSELTDPVIQRERFVAQARRRTGGDAEAMAYDEDFLRAIEYGMPPTGGMGMGVDRLLMAITGLGIRETILFPLTRVERM